MPEQAFYTLRLEKTVNKLYVATVQVWASSPEAALDVAHDRAIHGNLPWKYVKGCEADENNYEVDFVIPLQEEAA